MMLFERLAGWIATIVIQRKAEVYSRLIEMKEKIDSLERERQNLANELDLAQTNCKMLTSTVEKLQLSIKTDEIKHDLELRTLHATIDVREVSVRELTAHIASMHAIIEKDTAIAVSKREYALKGGLPYGRQLPE